MLLVAATDRELAGLEGVVCGVGPVDAAAATARALERLTPGAVLNVGLAGAHGFREPEVVLGSEARYCDAGSPLVPAAARPDAGLLAAARSALPGARVCPIGTSARVNGTSGCTVEAMEGFAVLRACALARVPALELRVTCNEISEPDRALWRYDEGLELLAARLPALLEALRA